MLLQAQALVLREVKKKKRKKKEGGQSVALTHAQDAKFVGG